MVKVLRQLVLGALVLGWLVPSAALAQAGSYSIVWDDFSAGLQVGYPGAKWFHLDLGGTPVGTDGAVWTYGGGMYVWASGWNPSTGEVAFNSTVAPESVSGIPGLVDHLKWAVYMNHPSSQGRRGFDTQWDYELSCSTTMAGSTYGTQFHPFGGHVANDQDDLRLATYGMATMDEETFMAFDFLFTNGRAYAVYERSPIGRLFTGANYAAFTYAIPVANVTPWSTHTTKIAYDKSAGVMKWILDGVEVFRVDAVGYRLPAQYSQHMIIDHRGDEEWVSLNQLTCGMGMFTLLDAASPWGSALVQLTQMFPYTHPQYGPGQPQWFADYDSNHGSRLFGQGAQFHVTSYSVESTQIYFPPPPPPPYECPCEYPQRYPYEPTQPYICPQYQYCLPYPQ